jgi:dTDP-4-amino-4,6-dideoxygalactose transaminase
MKKIALSEIDLTDEEINNVVRVLKSKWFSQGETVEKFENEFAKYLSVKYAIACSSGTSALHLALRAIDIKPNDEVIVPSLTFVATVNSVLYVNALPIFADSISLDNFNISPEEIEKKITEKTKAIIVVHYGGYPCEMDEIKKIAKKYNLFIIEDSAHSIGAEYKNKKCGTIGDIGCFSFFANKNITTGEGGMVVTNNKSFADKIRLLRSHGMTTTSLDRYKGHSFDYDVLDFGYNYRIDEIRAAIGLVQLKKLDKNNKKREELVWLYQQNLKDLSRIKIPFLDFPHKSSYHLFPIVLSKNINREKFMKELREYGIQTSIHYRPVHKFSFYKKIFGNIKLPVAEEIGKRVVTLPLHPLLKKEDVFYIVEKIKNLLII